MDFYKFTKIFLYVASTLLAVCVMMVRAGKNHWGWTHFLIVTIPLCCFVIFCVKCYYSIAPKVIDSLAKATKERVKRQLLKSGELVEPKAQRKEEIVQTTQEPDSEDEPKAKMKGPQKNFRMLIQYEDPDKLLKRLHELIDGNSGADVGAVLMNAFYNCTYLKRKPTQAEFESEFKLIGSWSAIKNYMDDNSLNATERSARIVIFED